MLFLFNEIFSGKQSFPSTWRKATVIPISKPGKDPLNPNNYRPIALTSCLCKVMERMVNNRLVWYLEVNEILTKFQAGFRKNRSANDQLVRFESLLRDAFINKDHVVSIFFDLEKAYDTAWKHGVKDMHESGLQGHLPVFVENFMRDREFNVRIGTTMPDNFIQEMGIPQGSIISPTLFNLKINSITKCLLQNVEPSLYVDDFLISYRSKNLNSIERKLQLCLRNLGVWCNENGFKFSATKTVCVHFTKSKKLHPDLELYLKSHKIPIVNQVKFLGVIFDKKLTFLPHIKSYLQILDPIAHQGLRLALGAFRSSPVESLLTEANELPLYLRRQKLSIQYCIKLAAHTRNPTYDCVYNPQYAQLYEAKEREIPSFGMRMKPLLENIDFELENTMKETTSGIPTWTHVPPKVNLDIAKRKKSETAEDVFRSNFNEFRAKFPNYHCIYTDGSKTMMQWLLLQSLLCIVCQKRTQK